MVVHTVTLDTAFDDRFAVSGLSMDGSNRVTSFATAPAGQGIMCARVAHALGVPVQVHALVGVEDRDDLEGRLQREGLKTNLLAMRGLTPHNLTLNQPDGTVVRADATGFDLRDSRPALHLVDQVVAAARPGDLVTLNGAVPRGVPTALWASAAARLLANDVRVIIDTSEDALVAALQIRRLLAVTPTEEEAAQISGAGTEAAALAGASLDLSATLARFAKSQVELPLVTLGAGGVAWRDEHGYDHRSWCPGETVVGVAGAGSAFVAGLVAGIVGSASRKAWITAAVAVAGAHLSGATGADLVTTAQQNLSRVQTEPLNHGSSSR